MRSNKKPKLYFRDVLLSTGEYTKEAVIDTGNWEVYESAPRGITLGLNEAILSTRGKPENHLLLEDSSIFELNQYSFDHTVIPQCDSQKGTALSMAFLKYRAQRNGFQNSDLYKFIAQSFSRKIKSPKPIFNILNGGKHAGNGLDFCEFMLIPGGSDAKNNIRIASEIYFDLKNIIKQKFGEKNTMVGREGGFAPEMNDIEVAIDLVTEAINVRNGGRCGIAIDIAANNFGLAISDKDACFEYVINRRRYVTDSLIMYYQHLIERFPEIVYLEDPFHENDITGWQKLTAVLRDKILIVADDLAVTNLVFLEKYRGCFNACILKINQIGSVSGLVDAFKFCVSNNIKTIISQRSGETDSDIIAHFSVGLGSEYIKAGAPARERIIKYNSLIRMETKIGKRNNTI